MKWANGRISLGRVIMSRFGEGRCMVRMVAGLSLACDSKIVLEG